MTKTQIKSKLIAAGMDEKAILEVGKDEVEIFVDNGEGRANERATEKAAKVARKVLGWGGYYTGYGSLVLQNNYQSSGDWNDRTSRCHY